MFISHAVCCHLQAPVAPVVGLVPATFSSPSGGRGPGRPNVMTAAAWAAIAGAWSRRSRGPSCRSCRPLAELGEIAATQGATQGATRGATQQELEQENSKKLITLTLLKKR